MLVTGLSEPGAGRNGKQLPDPFLEVDRAVLEDRLEQFVDGRRHQAEHDVDEDQADGDVERRGIEHGDLSRRATAQAGDRPRMRPSLARMELPCQADGVRVEY